MVYLTHTPSYPLSQFVESFWYGENAPDHVFERLLPNGDTDIVINLRDATLRIYDPSNLITPRCFIGPVLSGPHSRYYVIDTSQQSSLIGIQFRPGGAYPLIGDSPEQLHNRQVALEDLWGKSATELQTRLMDAPTHEMRFRILEDALLNRLKRTLVPHPAVALGVSVFTNYHGASSIAIVAERAGLSSRRFIELFRREVGLPPKIFCRILRFQHAIRSLSASAIPDFARVAYECGYYDQSHLIRDFKTFADLTPTAYLASQGVHYNHVKLAERG